MRAFPTGWSSTSGVLPIRSSSDGATTLRIAAPEVDRRPQLAEQLVDAPNASGGVRGDGGLAVTADQLLLAPVQSRQTEEVVGGTPRAVFDHPLAPFPAERRRGHERQSRRRCMALDLLRLRALRDDGNGVEERS